MAELIFITGGARSGKSRFAETLLSGYGNVLYLATAVPCDHEMEARIKKHRDMRDPRWTTIEAFEGTGDKLASFAGAGEAVLLDCLTVMISNLMLKDSAVDWDKVENRTVDGIERQIGQEIDQLLIVMRNFTGRAVIVSNEVGMGLVPDYPLGRFFRDIAGRMNQKIGQAADKVYFLVSGIPVLIKG